MSPPFSNPLRGTTNYLTLRTCTQNTILMFYTYVVHNNLFAASTFQAPTFSRPPHRLVPTHRGIHTPLPPQPRPRVSRPPQHPAPTFCGPHSGRHRRSAALTWLGPAIPRPPRAAASTSAPSQIRCFHVLPVTHPGYRLEEPCDFPKSPK